MDQSKGTNLGDMRFANELLVLNILRREPCSRAQLAKQTGLSRAGVTVIIDDLLHRGTVEETNESSNDLGRKALTLRVRADAAFVVGVHLRSEKYCIGLFDFNGDMLHVLEREYAPAECAAAQLIGVANDILTVVAEREIEREKVLGIGICISGPVDVAAGKVIRPSSKWHEVEIVSILESVVPWKCLMENRSNARAMYEKLYGVCRGFSSFIYFKVDDAVGGSIIYRDKIIGGYNNFGNEFGHMSIRCDGERCECGNQGCLDMYASVPAILAQFPQTGVDTWSALVDHAYDGDAAALQAIRAEAEYLSTGIVNLCNIFEPQAVVLSGDITYRPNLLLALISENVNRRHILRNAYNAQILVSDRQDHVNVRAGAAIVIEGFYQGKLMI